MCSKEQATKQDVKEYDNWMLRPSRSYDGENKKKKKES